MESGVKILYPGIVVAGVGDATYIYCQKSQRNHQYQRCLHSPYKKRHLFKLHVICHPNGQVIAVDGPFFGDDNNKDDKIWDQIESNDDHDIHRIVRDDSNDGNSERVAFALDRGYLGSKRKRYGRICPSKWYKDDVKQLSTEEANKGRFVLVTSHA